MQRYSGEKRKFNFIWHDPILEEGHDEDDKYDWNKKEMADKWPVCLNMHIYEGKAPHYPIRQEEALVWRNIKFNMNRKTQN